MATLNDTLKEGYISNVGNALKPYVEELTAKGFVATERVTELTGASFEIEDANKSRKEAEKALLDAIANENQVRDDFYTQAASTVSLVEGVLGKNHALTLKLRALRTALIGNQNPNGTPTPAPATKTA